MKIHGVFIGIDRYRSPSISWLNCAKRDAFALYALFEDNIAGSYEVLYDESATCENIENKINQLSECSPDDVVIISFSGHGSPEHHLVAYDSTVSNLAESAIPLNRLSEWFTKIPAKQLLCIIDCCFSGGLGAKALQLDFASRKAQSVEDLLTQFSGKGRVILTASKADEEAWEHSQHGHGLLTYHLLQALQGAHEVRKDGKIGIYRLLEYVTSNVKSSAGTIGQQQNPMLLGQIIEEITFPIFSPGSLYRQIFPERDRPTATSNILSLASFGFPIEILEGWQKNIPTLNELQLTAINEHKLLSGKHLVVAAPTSSGKTMIGELAAIYGVTQRKRTIFLLPLKALVNDKLRQFEECYLPYNIKTIISTGESTSDDTGPLMRGRYDICLMTYEKFTSIVLTHPYILNQIGTVVIDEAQMIADKSRGVNLEFILTLLKLKRRDGFEPQIIALSAVIGDLNGLDRWLGASLLSKTERPIPLNEGIIKMNGEYRYLSSDNGEERTEKMFTPEHRKGSSQDIIIPLVKKLVSEGKKVIVFREIKIEAQSCALYLAENLDLPPVTTALEALPSKDPSKTSQKLRTALSKGVAFHISDLDQDERQIVEENFRDKSSDLKVIVATTTLAMGVNTPAEAVIVAGLSHPKDVPYTVAEYKNIIGRAGRLGYAERGESYLIAMTGGAEYSYWKNYITALPEDLRSNFLASQTDIRSLILRVISASGTKRGLTAIQITSFLEESLGAFQEKLKYGSWTWNSLAINNAIIELAKHQLISDNGDGTFYTTSLGKIAGDSGVEVGSVLRIIDCIQQLSSEQLTDPALIAITQLSIEMEQVYMPINTRSTYKEPQTWSAEMQRQGITSRITASFSKYSGQHTETTSKSKKTITCLLWITSTQLIEMENRLMQHHYMSEVAGAIRAVVARTSDILPIVGRICEELKNGLELNERISRLLIRLELGVPNSILEISKVIGRTLTRGEYLQLIKVGILTPNDFAVAEVERLKEILTDKKIEICKQKFETSSQNEFIISNQVLPDIPLYEG